MRKDTKTHRNLTVLLLQKLKEYRQQTWHLSWMIVFHYTMEFMCGIQQITLFHLRYNLIWIFFVIFVFRGFLFLFYFSEIPYLPVYNTRPCIIRTPFFDQIFHKQKFSEQKKNVNSSYNWRFAVVSFVTISNFLSLVITVIRYDRNVYLVSCFLNTLLNLFMDRNWKCFIGRLFNSS